MLYNLRSDIIYFKTGSDFELEFNLCGCCRMRLLTDKPSNKKAFVHSLARAVSRSRVILIAGSLFGEENTIEIVAQALGSETEIVDNTAFNIASDDQIEIIKGSLPLVTADGTFGGCIIESGPQTMILLTDNKTIRKSIMASLIHPYISELYNAEISNQSSEAIDEAHKAVPYTAEEQFETDGLIIEETAPQQIEANEIEEHELIIEEQDEPDEIADDLPLEDSELVIDSHEEIDTDSIIERIAASSQIILEEDDNNAKHFPKEYETTFQDLFFDNEKEKEAPVNVPLPKNESLYLSDDGDFFDINEIEADEKPTSRLSIATIIVTAVLLLAIIVLCYCIFVAASNDGIAPAAYIKEIWQTVFV